MVPLARNAAHSMEGLMAAGAANACYTTPEAIAASGFTQTIYLDLGF